MPWFSAIKIAKLLEYVNAKKAIKQHVDADYKKTFVELEKHVINKPKNTKPNTIYMNEAGLFQLSLKSTKLIAMGN
jgi:prophage antirepressor-like protein